MVLDKLDSWPLLHRAATSALGPLLKLLFEREPEINETPSPSLLMKPLYLGVLLSTLPSPVS